MGEGKMSFSNPQNDINPELANGCGSLALEDVWPATWRERISSEKFNFVPVLSHNNDSK